MTKHDLPTRDQVPEELTWRLEDIFASEEDYQAAFETVSKKIDGIKKYEGTLNQGAEALLAFLKAYEEVSRDLGQVYVYAHLKNDQDTSNNHYQDMHDRASNLLTKFSENISWYTPELFALDEDQLKTVLEENEDLQIYQQYFDELLQSKQHTLSADKELLLAGASSVMDQSSTTFSLLNNADIQFPKVKNEEGQEVQLSHGSYGQLMESTDRSVRQAAFEAMYETYGGLQNTLASTLQGNTRKNNFLAKARNFSSARERALFNNKIPESVYDNLLEVVNEYLPVFHQYLKLKQEILGLDEMHMYDMYAPLEKNEDLAFTYDEAKEVTLKALAPLGEDYVAILEEAFENRWIDVVENKGKRSGAYSSGTYDTNPYILMNWHDSLDQLYTLVHELGHSVHSYYTHHEQPYIYGDYSIFLAEIASTTNENLLTAYLLDQAKTDKDKISILDQYLDGFKGTIFRQTQFAEFEHFIYQADQADKPLTAQFLNENYAKLNAKYYGDGVVQDDEIRLEWSRIPHFYYNYYVYQYATGYAAAVTLADKILNEGGADQYKDYLKAGTSAYPIDVMKKAGVDMTQKDFLRRALDIFQDRVEELAQIIEK